jgi:alpha-L-rhamnosidase
MAIEKIYAGSARVVLVAAALCAIASAQADTLRDGFTNPPDTARPRVWWHWMNGNVTQDGIAKDFTWMKRVGIGGVQNFDANLATPQIVNQRLVYMTPEWKDAFRFAVNEAQRLSLEFAIAASPGWSETGGPWVEPKDGLKKIVWTETVVPGGTRFTGKLAAPPSRSGPFQDLPHVDALASLMGGHVPEPPAFYSDVAVFAVPVTAATEDEVPQTHLDNGTPQSPAFVRMRYAAPRAIRSATFFLEGGWSLFSDPPYLPSLEAHVDGAWRQITTLPSMGVPTTVSFAPVVAQEFRVVLRPYTGPSRSNPGESAPGAMPIRPGGAVANPLKGASLHLGSEARIDRFEAKAGFAIARDYYALSTDADVDAPAVPLSRVLNITSRMKPDGTLDWTPPPGRWRVLRLGYSLLGTMNHPAPPEATGLEVDKFDGPAVRRYIETYLRMYRETVGDQRFGKQGLRALLTDSIEVGAANWTPKMAQQFKRLRGYDPLPWLPTLTGVIIESRARSDAFLYDYRRTLADLMASEHYATVAAVAHAQNLTVYGEALEDQRPSLGDDMAMRAHADTPMAALWAWNRGFKPRPTLLGDMKGASSVAHVYGRPYVAAESMTSANSPWAFAPSDLRRIIDLEFAYGINRPVIHTSVHQPVDDKTPGLSLAIFGQYFNRHETWAEMARPWVDYLSRSSYLLQQGRNVADVAYFYGEEQPLTSLYGTGPLQDVPRQYAFDFVNVDALRNLLSVQNGDLVANSGARYRVLYLGGSSARMTLPTLQRIAQLVEAGATVVGAPPVSSPALNDNAAAFAALAGRMWSASQIANFGKGRVIASRDIEAAMGMLGIQPDFHYSKPASDTEVLFVHRRLSDGDVYFVNNRGNRAESVEARFRMTGRRPEIWRADTGAIEPVSYRIEAGVTVVPLELAAEDSLFVMFREAANVDSASISKKTFATVAELSGAWDVAFQPERGAPAFATFDRLVSLSDNSDAGIRYFSGISTYTRSFMLPIGVAPGTPLLLNLGQLGDVAEVHVNGQLVGTAWRPPYRLEIGAATKAGPNTLEVRVANLWVNRLIGDAQPNAKKIAFTAAPTYTPNAPLRPSGLIGPVTLQLAQ